MIKTPRPTQISDLKARRARLECEIEKAPGWGELRKTLNAELREIDQTIDALRQRLLEGVRGGI